MKKLNASPFKPKPGLWSIKVTDPLTQKRRAFYGSTKAEAEAKAYECLAQAPCDPEDRSLFAFYSKVYLPTVVGRSQPWKDQIGWAMDGYVLPHFGHWRVEDIKRRDVQDFFNRLVDPPAKSSRDKIRIVFGGVMNLAVMDEMISTNPAAHIRITGREVKDATVLTFAELAVLLNAVHPRSRPAVLLMGCCGLRISEARGVTRSSIKDGVLTVAQQMTKNKSETQQISTKLKTKSSYRAIPLPKEILDQLLEGSDLIILKGKGGKSLSHNAIRGDIIKALKSTKLPMITPHELRKTFFSLLENELEAPRPIVKALGGHKKEEITDLYSKSTMAQKAKYMEAFWKRLSTDRMTKLWDTQAEKSG